MAQAYRILAPDLQTGPMGVSLFSLGEDISPQFLKQPPEGVSVGDNIESEKQTQVLNVQQRLRDRERSNTDRQTDRHKKTEKQTESVR